MSGVLLVHRGYPPGSSGGSEIHLAGLARALAARGPVTVVHPVDDPGHPDGELRESDADGVRVVAIGTRRPPASGFEAYRDPLPPALARLLRETRPDVVHVHHLEGLSTEIVFEARRLGLPVVITLHDFWPACALGQLFDLAEHVCAGPTPTRCLGCVGGQVAAPAALRAAVRRLPALPAPAARAASRLARLGGAGASRVAGRLAWMRAVLSAADAIVAPSRFLAARMEALGFPRAEVVPNGHRPLPRAPRAADPAGRVRVGFVGAAIPSKGVHVLAEAFRRLADPAAVLRIHGDFVPYHGDTGYERRVRAILGDAAGGALRGPFPHAERGRVLAEIDVLVVPSLWEENAPLTVEEAFQAGVPVVVSDHGGLAERVRHDVDGLRFAPGDPDALAAALRRVIHEPGLRARLAAAAPDVRSMPAHLDDLDVVYARARARVSARAGRVGVVVLDHGRPEDAERAADSTDDPVLRPRILVVRNGGGAAPPSARPILVLAGNRGYAAGMNAGLAALREQGCDRILLLNNDALLEPGALRLMAEALDDPSLAAVGPVILRERDGRVESRGARIHGRWLWPRLEGSGEAHARAVGWRTVPSLSGAAWMVRASALDAVGALDEGYFHSFEEADWCWRARAAGLRLAVVLGAVARHGGARTLGAGSPLRLYYAARGHLRAAARIAPVPAPLRWGRDAAVVAVNAAHALRQGDVPRLAALAAVARGAADFARGVTGPAPEPRP